MKKTNKDARSVIAAPLAKYGTVVTWDGTLVRRYGDPQARLKIYDGVRRVMSVVSRPEHDLGEIVFGFGDPPILTADLDPSQSLHEGYLPLVRTHLEFDGWEINIDAFGWSDKVPVDLVEIAATNRDGGRRTLPVWVGLRGQARELNRTRDYVGSGDLGWTDQGLVLSHRLVVFSDPQPYRLNQTHPPRGSLDERVQALVGEIEHQRGSSPEVDAVLREFEADVAESGLEYAGVFLLDKGPGESGAIHLTLPTPPAHLHDRPKVRTMTSYGNAREACLDYWGERAAEASQVTLPSRELTDLYQASVLNVLLLGMIDEGHLVLCPGKAEYRRFWTRDASFMCWALDLAGLHRIAAEALDYFVYLQANPHQRWAYARIPDLVPFMADHGFDCPIGQWDGQGQAPWSMYQHYSLTGDRDWLAGIYPSMKRAAEWIREARSLMRGQTGQSMNWDPGLLPPGIAEGVNNEPDQYFVLQFWALHGLSAVLQAANALGHSDDAAWLGQEHEDLLRSVRSAIDRAFMNDADTFWLAATPTPTRDINTSMSRYYEAFLHWPYSILDDDDPRIAELFEAYDKKWLADGVMAFRKHPEDGLAARELVHRAGSFRRTGQWPPATEMRWLYGASLIALAYLRRGRGDAAAGIFDAVVGRAHSTRNWVEIVDLSSGRGRGDQPHGWAAAAYIALVRMMMLREEGTTLELFSGIPRAWTRPGSSLRFDHLPSEFGRVSASLTSDLVSGELLVHAGVDLPRQSNLGGLKLHLRLDAGWTPISVSWNERSLPSQGSEVGLPPESGQLILRARPSP